MIPRGRISFRFLMILASLIWLGLCIALLLYWRQMPSYLAWLLAILAAALATDARMLKIALGIEDLDGKKDSRDGSNNKD